MRTPIAAMITLLVAMAPVHARSEVLQCVDEMPSFQDDWLQRSAAELKAKHPRIGFQHDDRPCQHARDTAKALIRTLGRNYLKGMSGYQYVKITNGEGYLTIERFRSKNPRALQALAAALKKNRSHKLKIEANTSYEFFRARNSIIIMVSSATGRKTNSKMFEEVRESFTSLARGGASSTHAK